MRVAEDVVGGDLLVAHLVPELEHVASPACPATDLGHRGARALVGLDPLGGHFLEQAAGQPQLAGLADRLEQSVVDEDLGLDADLPHLLEDELDAVVVAGLAEHLGEHALQRRGRDSNRPALQRRGRGSNRHALQQRRRRLPLVLRRRRRLPLGRRRRQRSMGGVDGFFLRRLQRQR